jgi:hypothetical protein
MDGSNESPSPAPHAPSIEERLRQYIVRPQEDSASPHVAEMQHRVSALAKALANGSAEDRPAYRRKFSPAPDHHETTSSAAAHTYESFFGEDRNGAPKAAAPEAQQDEERHHMAREWLENRFNELRGLIEAKNGDDEASNRGAAIEQRIEEILQRLNAMQAITADPPSLKAVQRQLQHVGDHLVQQTSQQQAHAVALDTIGTRLETLDKTMQHTAENVASRAEAAVFSAASKSSRQTFELTARHLSEALKQTSPAARFAAIETEVRSLNQQTRETGQRTVRAVQDVDATLRQFLQQVAPSPHEPSLARRAGLTTPVSQAPQSPETLRAPQRPPRDKSAKKPEPLRPDISFATGHDDDFEAESSRRVRNGLIAGVLILLLASILLLSLNIFNDRSAIPFGNLTNKAAKTASWSTQSFPVDTGARIVLAFNSGENPLAVSQEPDDGGAADYRAGARLHRDGKGVRTLAQAVYWYERAAAKGHALAMHNLGVIYSKRRGAENYQAAMVRFLQAASLGVVDSQFNLAVLLEKGLADAPDVARAFQWYSVAASAGDAESAAKCEQLRALLTGAEIAAAKKFAASWKAKAARPAAQRVASLPAGRKYS